MRVCTVGHSPSPKAHAFVVSGDLVTLRVFEPVSDDEGRPDATEDQIVAALHNHGVPFRRAYPDTSILYPASLFLGLHDKSGRFSLSGEMCWKLDRDVLGSASASDRSVWCFMHQSDGGFLQPFNSTLDYLPARRPATARHADKQANSVLTIYQPYADSPLDDCTLVLSYNEALGYHHTFADTAPLTPGSPLPANIWPRLRVTGPETLAPDSYATVDVEVLHPEQDEIDTRCNSTLYLEDVEGYTPISRAKVSQGRASFRVGALGLAPGERVRVKVNWRNWLGDAEYTALVSQP